MLNKNKNCNQYNSNKKIIKKKKRKYNGRNNITVIIAKEKY